MNYKRHILIVGDDESCSVETGAHFINLGCEVEYAKNGTEAFKMATQKRYDLIIMDLDAPSMMMRSSKADNRKHLPH